MSESPEAFPSLEQLDRDGAVREAAERAGGATRATFFRRSGMLAGGGLLLGAMPGSVASAQSGSLPGGDVDILNFALTLEYLEAAFYKEAMSKGALSGETKTFANVVAGHEADHVSALKKTLGSKATKRPSFDFKGTTSDQSSFRQTAMKLEDLGVTAYEGQAGEIKTPAVLAAAASILPVEARHASWIRAIIGNGTDPSPAPDAFNPAKSKSQVLDAVKETGFITSS